MVEIFLFPVRVTGGSRLHLSTTHPAARCQPYWDTSGLQAVSSWDSPKENQTCWSCSPCLPHHPRRNWPQDSLHHSQVLPVVMCLGERSVKGKAWNRFQQFCPGYSPTQTPSWQTPRVFPHNCSDGGTPIRPGASGLCWEAASILSPVGKYPQNTVLTWKRVKPT